MTPHAPMLGPELEADSGTMRVKGDWTLRALTPELGHIRGVLARAQDARHWRLDTISRLDSFGATLLWQAWGERLPEKLDAPDAIRAVFDELAAATREGPPRKPRRG